jgi:hypothetical protein
MVHRIQDVLDTQVLSDAYDSIDGETSVSKEVVCEQAMQRGSAGPNPRLAYHMPFRRDNLSIGKLELVGAHGAL